MANVWLDASGSDIALAISQPTFLACFDDDNAGAADATAVQAVITRAENQVLSWLSEYGPQPFSAAVLAQLGADPLLKDAAIKYAIAYTFDRHPEYIRSTRDESGGKRLKDADAMMERILDARQRPPTVATTPANVGGVVVDNGPRLYVDSADGSTNSGDY